MSFDVFIFERRETIKTSLDVLVYYKKFVECNEDYSLSDSSDIIFSWAKKMFEKFPPMRGEYASYDDISYATEKEQKYLANYHFGAHGAYCSFSDHVAEEALEYLKRIADNYMVGVYDMQASQ